MKIYIKSSVNLPYKIKYEVQDIMDALDKGRKVYIEYGSLNDVLTGYTLLKSKDPVGYDTVIFNATGATQYFGNKVDLSVFGKVDYTEEGNIMIVEVAP